MMGISCYYLLYRDSHKSFLGLFTSIKKLFDENILKHLDYHKKLLLRMGSINFIKSLPSIHLISMILFYSFKKICSMVEELKWSWINFRL